MCGRSTCTEKKSWIGFSSIKRTACWVRRVGLASNKIGAWTVVEAESLDDAAKLFLNHPHFTIFPGESVEVMECLSIPGM